MVSLRQAKLKQTVSEKAILSREAGRHFISNFTIKYGKYSVLVIKQEVVFSILGEIYLRQGGDL